MTDFADIMDFVIVYIQEAHPEESWTLPENKISRAQHRNIEDRINAAMAIKECGNCPIVVDTFQNTGTLKYTAFPESLYVIDENKKVCYSALGPYSYFPSHLRKWIEARLNKSK